MTTAAVSDAPVTNDEYRDWIIKVTGFLTAVLGVKLVYAGADVDEVGRFDRTTREVTGRIGAPLEDLVWLLNGVLDEFGAEGLFGPPDAERRPTLRLVSPPRSTEEDARPDSYSAPRPTSQIN
jgi:hypothetical protein